MIIFDAIADKGRPAAPLPGLKPIAIHTHGGIWGDAPMMEIPPAANLDLLAASTSVLCLDIEAFALSHVYHPDISDATKEKNRQFLGSICDALHERNPALMLGLYSELPTEYGNNLKYEWHNREVRRDAARFKYSRDSATGLFDDLGLADRVNVIFPSGYFRSPTYDVAEWKTMLTAQVELARIYQKKIYPFLWPCYSDPGHQTTLVPVDTWRRMLDHALAIADGCVIWSQHDRMPWSNDLPWWIETQKLIAEKAESE